MTIRNRIAGAWSCLRGRSNASAPTIPIEVASIPTTNYVEVIEIRVPIRFYWADDGFDGIEFGEFKSELLPWQEDMVSRCLSALSEQTDNQESQETAG